MAVTLTQTELALGQDFKSTNKINNQLRQNWATTYGQLSRLVAEGRAECIEIRSANRTLVVWRKKQVKE